VLEGTSGAGCQRGRLGWQLAALSTFPPVNLDPILVVYCLSGEEVAPKDARLLAALGGGYAVKVCQTAIRLAGGRLAL